MLDHSWTFNAADCANQRVAIYRDTNPRRTTDPRRTWAERSTALNLRKMAASSFDILNPAPKCPDIFDDNLHDLWKKEYLRWHTAKGEYFQKHLGLDINTSDYADWYYRMGNYRLEPLSPCMD